MHTVTQSLEVRLTRCLFLSFSVERQLKELQAKMRDTRTEEHSPSPLECLHWFTLRANHSLKSVTAEHEELMDFYRALVDTSG